ncbi:anthranilate synthase component I family protein [Phenylobacterium sp. LjRoot219]|uniref:anthranilate synthase component I family protein n=1 Tax=Phenylobacterium sp. LjRoot219 TaxID=3342283 RepID=UPI003F5092E2
MAVFHEAPWSDPAQVLSALGERPWTIGFLTGGAEPGWSYVAADPAAVCTLAPEDSEDPIAALAALLGPTVDPDPAGPPFQGGVAGLLGYELGDRFEPIGLPRHDGWPDLACARYDALLAFDHAQARVLAIGRGATEAEAAVRAATARSWLDLPPRPAQPPGCELQADSPEAYEAAVAETVERIAAGEIFQANLARRWRGRLAPDARPIDLMIRLAATSPAPFAAYLRLPDRAIVSNSPERFLKVERQDGGLVAETQPIKGTAPRGATPAEDEALAAGLSASVKDRAENLMIVDLMRNDLARVCTPGAVRTPELFRLASFANVHHLVSTVTGRLAAGRTAGDLLRAAFPPGSITGAPKVQAMKVIAGLEGGRGPFFGSLVWLGCDGGLDSSVLIRTAAFVHDADGWRVEARAGAGIVADSRPASERAETETKIAAVAAALQN